MLHRVKKRPALKRGVAIVNAGKLRALGFKIFGDLEHDETHVCVHCNECNKQEYDCVSLSPPCPLLNGSAYPIQDQQTIHSVRRKLVTELVVLFEAIYLKTELLSIFATDFSENDKAAANDEYERRLNSHRIRQIKLVESAKADSNASPVGNLTAAYSPATVSSLKLTNLPELFIDIQEKHFSVDVPHTACDPKKMQTIFEDAYWHNVELQSLPVTVAEVPTVRIYRFVGRVIRLKLADTTTTTMTFDKFGDVEILTCPLVDKTKTGEKTD
ncbi:MAG: hypothetical protein C0508_25235 [Cyanobacteria bacterium PR.023]|nr:hypothetical protein [Cyanobacteria bacterium PR.023]